MDPLAEGVVVLGIVKLELYSINRIDLNSLNVLGIGKATTLLGGYLSGSKKYIATGVLGSETDTLDCTGSITATKDCSNITLENIESAIPKFIGEITQIPPMYSALKKDGKRLYDLARAGQVIERQPRNVTVYDIKLQRNVELPKFVLEVECGGGFYIRSLISDLSQECGGVAHMTDLQRIKQGPFLLSDCIYPESWKFEEILNHLERFKDFQ